MPFISRTVTVKLTSPPYLTNLFFQMLVKKMDNTIRRKCITGEEINSDDNDCKNRPVMLNIIEYLPGLTGSDVQI